MQRLMRPWLVPIAASLILASCGDDASEELPRPVPRAEAPPDPEERPDRLYDLEGNLLESEEVIAGLTLPRGLTAAGEMDRFHAYRSDVPIEKLQAYFGPRLITGQVDRHGSAATFRDAVPRGVTGGVVHLDVAIVPMNQISTRIEVREIPPVPDHPPSEDEVIRHWNEEQDRLE